MVETSGLEAKQNLGGWAMEGILVCGCAWFTKKPARMDSGGLPRDWNQSELGLGGSGDAIGFAVFADHFDTLADEGGNFVSAFGFWSQGDGGFFAVCLCHNNFLLFSVVGFEGAFIGHFLTAGCLSAEGEGCHGEECE